MSALAIVYSVSLLLVCGACCHTITTSMSLSATAEEVTVETLTGLRHLLFCLPSHYHIFKAAWRKAFILCRCALLLVADLNSMLLYYLYRTPHFAKYVYCWVRREPENSLRYLTCSSHKFYGHQNVQNFDAIFDSWRCRVEKCSSMSEILNRLENIDLRVFELQDRADCQTDRGTRCESLCDRTKA